MNSTRLFVCTGVTLLLGISNAWADCEQDWLTIDARADTAGRNLVAQNVNEYPVTYAVRIRSERIAGGQSQSFTGSLDGQEFSRLMKLPESVQSVRDLSISCRWTVGSHISVHDDNHHYLLPYADGTSYRVLQGFGSRFSHRGNEQYAVDFKMSVGTPVHAARGGIVARIEESHNKGCWEDGCGAFANFIVVLHDDGTTGEYYHLQQNGALVEIGEAVVAGQKIGLSGNTGHTTMPHLHFAVYRATRRARSQSIPFTFISSDGVVRKPRRGRHYLAVMQQKAGD